MAALPTIRFASNPKPVPILGYGSGTALFKQDTTKSVSMAIGAGFRFLDFAEVYANSEYGGKAIDASGNKDNLFILTKLLGGMKTGIEAAAKEELKKLTVPHLDACLLHAPPRGKDGNPSNVDAWKEMEKLKDAGIAKTIGVSNWLASDIQEVLDSKPKHPIEINQIEFHPLIYSDKRMQDAMKVMKENNIKIAVYGGLVPITRSAKIAENAVLPVLSEIAKAKPGRSDGTVLLKWASQRSEGLVITTTGKESRANEYLDAFAEGKGGDDKLSEEELKRIDEAGAKSTTYKGFMAPYWD